MKCPNCGEEMPEGSLYCEHCGEEIHMVPDFEPELEGNIEQSIQNILEDIKQDEEEKTRKQGKKDTGSGRKRMWKFWGIFAALVLFTAVGM